MTKIDKKSQKSDSAVYKNLIMIINNKWFTLNYLNKKQWPPASPDLNPCDYYLWPELSRRVYEGRRTPFKSIDELK